MVKDVYVSDADMEMSKDVESIRIDRHLVEDLSSIVPGRRRKMVDRIEEHARKNLLSVMPVLAKYYNHDSPKVRDQVRESLSRLASSEKGEQALIECVFSKNRRIADTAAGILEGKNYGSLNFLSVYRQTKSLIAQAWKGEVFAQDIEELVVDSIETYKEGRFDQGMTNLTMARDLLEDRLEWHSHLRSYIKDVLKLTPDLSRSGVQVDSIQDSIRHLSSAIPEREYTEAKKLLELRRQETHLWKQLWSLEEFISKRITEKPSARPKGLQDSDKELMDSFLSVGKKAQSAVQDGEAAAALKLVSEFIRGDVSAHYLASDGERLGSDDETAGFVVWSVGLGLLKLIAPIVPNVAEEFYQLYFRDREEAASIHSVSWPEPFRALDIEPRAEPAKPRKTTKKKPRAK